MKKEHVGNVSISPGWCLAKQSLFSAQLCMSYYNVPAVGRLGVGFTIWCPECDMRPPWVSGLVTLSRYSLDPCCRR